MSDGSVFDSSPKKLSDTGLVVPPTGKWLQVKSDAERLGYPRQKLTSYQNREVPATVMMWGMRPPDFVPLTKEWQQRHYELMRHVVGGIPQDGNITGWWANDPVITGKPIDVPEGTPHSFPVYPLGTLMKAYGDLWANHVALTDGHAYNVDDIWGREYVLGVNLNSHSPCSIKSLAFSGALLHELDIQPSNIGSEFIAVEAFDYLKPPPTLDYIISEKPYLVVWLTEQGGVDREILPPVNGVRRWTVARFPHLEKVCELNGIPAVGTPYLLPSFGGWNLIAKADVKRLENGMHYSPYVPEKW